MAEDLSDDLPLGHGGNDPQRPLMAKRAGGQHRDPPEHALAEAQYRQALALADEIGMRPLQAHCHLGLGALYRQLGRLEEARTALSTAIDLYRTMEMSLWLLQAETALAQMAWGDEKP